MIGSAPRYRVLVTHAATGYNGISWDYMGHFGRSWNFRGFSAALSWDVLVLFSSSEAVDKSVIPRIGRESLPLEPGKLRQKRIEIVPGVSAYMIHVQ
jgi:hypothetical protein